MPPIRLDDNFIQETLRKFQLSPQTLENQPSIKIVDVFIAGSGPIGAGFARTILDTSQNSQLKVLMADIGAQDGPGIGVHQKNTIKYQKDIDAFVNVIKGALQKISVPPADTYIPTLGGDGWTPSVDEKLIFQGNNPNQDPRVNLKDAAVTRTIGGMATHWTCACPFPNDEETIRNPIDNSELKDLLQRASNLLNVHDDQYDSSIRHTVVKKWLSDRLPERDVRSLRLGVERRQDNPSYVTWTGTNTVFGSTLTDSRFELWQESRVTSLHHLPNDSKVVLAKVRRLTTDEDVLVIAKAFIIACGAVGTPQILSNSTDLRLPQALGHYLCEQSISFCQIVLKTEIIDYIRRNPEFSKKVKEHETAYPLDPLPIPFDDPEPQVSIPYSPTFPWHTQIHRDAFSYGDVGPRSDSMVVVDLRFFGKQDVNPNNHVYFGKPRSSNKSGIPDTVTIWQAGVTDIYGMPQATFEVQRSKEDRIRDQRMMEDMTQTANILGAYLPGSEPQFMNPGLALHITGTTRIGTNVTTSVADPSSKVHGYENLWVGGNGCIPDSTACNPTLTSLAIALKAADSIVKYLGTGSHGSSKKF